MPSSPSEAMPEYRTADDACCPNFVEQVKRIDGQVAVQQIRTGRPLPDDYFVRWKFCPWCGASRLSAALSVVPAEPVAWGFITDDGRLWVDATDHSETRVKSLAPRVTLSGSEVKAVPLFLHPPASPRAAEPSDTHVGKTVREGMVTRDPDDPRSNAIVRAIPAQSVSREPDEALVIYQMRRVAVCKMLGRVHEAVSSFEADNALRLALEADERPRTDFAESVRGLLDAFNLRVQRNADGFLEFVDVPALYPAPEQTP